MGVGLLTNLTAGRGTPAVFLYPGGQNSAPDDPDVLPILAPLSMFTARNAKVSSKHFGAEAIERDVLVRPTLLSIKLYLTFRRNSGSSLNPTSIRLTVITEGRRPKEPGTPHGIRPQRTR